MMPKAHYYALLFLGWAIFTMQACIATQSQTLWRISGVALLIHWLHVILIWINPWPGDDDER